MESAERDIHSYGLGVALGVPLLELPPLRELPPLPLPLVEGTGLDFLDPFGVLPGRPRKDPVEDPEMLLMGVCPGLLPKSALPTPEPCPCARGGLDTNGNRASNRPNQLLVKNASRSLSSLLRSNAVRYLSYESRNPRSTLDEKMSSPRGLLLGGIVGIGTLDGLRLFIRTGLGGLGGGVADGAVLANGLRDRRRGCRRFRYMLKVRRARLACGT